MKKNVLAIFTLLAFSGAFAQFNKGRSFIGGSVSFSSYTDKSNTGGTTSTPGTTTDFSISPSVGYFVANRLAVGGGISWASSHFSPDTGSSSTGSAFLFSPLVRYYFGPGFFGQGTFGVGSSKGDYKLSSSSTITVKGSVTAWSLGIGYAIFLNDHVALEPLVAYQSTAIKYDGTGDPKDTSTGLAINFGIRAYLGDRK
jgi:outer membrane protein